MASPLRHVLEVPHVDNNILLSNKFGDRDRICANCRFYPFKPELRPAGAPCHSEDWDPFQHGTDMACPLFEPRKGLATPLSHINMIEAPEHAGRYIQVLSLIHI